MRRMVLCLLGLSLTVGMVGCGEKKPDAPAPAPAGDAAPAEGAPAEPGK